MVKHNQDGAVNSILVISSLGVLLIVVLIFGIWAFSGRQHYKNNAQSLINTAVASAKVQQSSLDNAQYNQDQLKTLTTYNGPEDFGSVVVQYPKSWSGYIDTSGENSNAFAAYFNPGTVPTISSQTSVIALTVQVLSQPYSQVVQSFQQQAGVTSNAYALPKVPKVVGLEVSGPVGQNQTDETMVVLPLRTNTLEISTDGTQYLDAFNSAILPNLSFSP
jgi:hypothetical protein